MTLVQPNTATSHAKNCLKFFYYFTWEPLEHTQKRLQTIHFACREKEEEPRQIILHYLVMFGVNVTRKFISQNMSSLCKSSSYEWQLRRRG